MRFFAAGLMVSFIAALAFGAGGAEEAADTAVETPR